MKHYLITGGTGLIGSALCHKFLSDNHRVTVLSRDPQKAVSICGSAVSAVQSLNEIANDTKIDVVINLAGAPVADQRWTKSRKQVIEDSRIALTADLVEWIASQANKPECLISASAVGWYGDSGSKVLDEESSFHDEYTHQLCDAWEQQAQRAEQYGVRVCILRIGLVLAPDGGFLLKMLLPFKLGLGAQLGNGEQFMPWIHMIDVLRLIAFLLEEPSAVGIYNVCAPNPVNNKTFTQTLAKQLSRPAFLVAPSWFLSLVLGEMSRLLITGQQAVPKKALVQGFEFNYTELSSALNAVLSTKG